MFLCKRSQSCYSIHLVHHSTIIEIMYFVKQRRRGCSPAMAISSDTFARSAGRLVAVVCAARVLVQIGAILRPALMPGSMPLWKLFYREAGWITARCHGACMLSVPVLVTLTDCVEGS